MFCHIGMSVKPVNTSMSITINPWISSSWHGTQYGRKTN
uniref:Uncharacterized protein n=1 Tax=Rhizophora mucronata TaxID=61149 RepID=A0A2P2NZM5_RHIMU